MQGIPEGNNVQCASDDVHEQAGTPEFTLLRALYALAGVARKPLTCTR